MVDGIEVDLGPTYVILHPGWQHNNSITISNITLKLSNNQIEIIRFFKTLNEVHNNLITIYEHNNKSNIFTTIFKKWSLTWISSHDK